MSEDYYTVLKVPRDASIEDIQDALRQENMKWSRRSNNAPRAADRYEAEQRVELLAQAKAVLTDPVRRAQYDASIGIVPRAPVMNPVDPAWPRIEQPQPPPQAPPQPPPMWPPAKPIKTDGPRRASTAGTRISHPVWTTVLVLFAILAFASAVGQKGSAKDPLGNVIIGIVALLIAWRVSGMWRRRR